VDVVPCVGAQFNYILFYVNALRIKTVCISKCN